MIEFASVCGAPRSSACFGNHKRVLRATAAAGKSPRSSAAMRALSIHAADACSLASLIRARSRSPAEAHGSSLHSMFASRIAASRAVFGSGYDRRRCDKSSRRVEVEICCRLIRIGGLSQSRRATKTMAGVLFA